MTTKQMYKIDLFHTRQSIYGMIIILIITILCCISVWKILQVCSRVDKIYRLFYLLENSEKLEPMYFLTAVERENWLYFQREQSSCAWTHLH